MGLTGSNTTSCGSAQLAALRVAAAQHAFVQAHSAFTSAFADLKAGKPEAKTAADKATADLKAAKAELEDAQKAHETAQANSASLTKTADALASCTAPTNLPSNPRSAFKDISTMTSLDAFPSIAASPCSNKACVRSAATRTLQACPCNIADAFAGCKGLDVVRGHLHASRFTNPPEDVQRSAKEVYAVVNDKVMHNRGGAFGGSSGRKGQKSFGGQGFSKGARGRKG